MSKQSKRHMGANIKSTEGVDAITVADDGNVGIGTDSPIKKLHIASPGDVIRIDSTNSNTFKLGWANNGTVVGYMGAAGDSPLVVANGSATERMRIDANGHLLIGQDAAANPPPAAADIYAGGLFLNPNRRTAANAASAYWEAATGVFYRSTSSIRYKTDVQDYTKGLTEVLSMRPVSFKGKEGPNLDKTFAGFIAEEIEQLNLKEFVEYDAEGRPDALAYSQFSALLVKAIQELKAELDEAKAEIAALKVK